MNATPVSGNRNVYKVAKIHINLVFDSHSLLTSYVVGIVRTPYVTFGRYVQVLTTPSEPECQFEV